MNRCKTCAYWNDEICGHPKPGFEIEVRVADDHNLDYWLKTNPDFGCVSHTPIK